MRRDIRAWPAREGCFARESSSRRRSPGKPTAMPAAASVYAATDSIIALPALKNCALVTPPALQEHDRADAHSCAVAARGRELPPYEPHTADRADPFHGLVQQDREVVGARSIDRVLAVDCEPRPR